MLSLNARLVSAATVALAAFLGLTGVTLDKAFRDSAETAVRERLQAQIYTLLAAADLDARGRMVLPGELPEARFSQPGSGLYAQVTGSDAAAAWRSASLLGQQIEFDGGIAPGAWRFERSAAADGVPVYQLDFGVRWENARGQPQDYTFSVAETLDAFQAQVQRFRRSLWIWLGGAALVLLALQGSILRWSLAPLRRVARDLAAIEAGRHEQLEGEYPRELRGLTHNLNALLANERRQLARHRDALADLAHSLKTPLAVLRGALSSQDPTEQVRATADEQIARMTQLVDYHLQRAGTSGRTTLMAPVALAPLATRVQSSVARVYADKPVRCDVDIDAAVAFPADEGDLLELFGNLIDNAYKWCRSQVRITGRLEDTQGDAPGMLVIEIEDDGSGVPKDKLQSVLQRGVRADERVSGHGIGLAVVQDIVRAYGGKLEIGSAGLGGARICVSLPVR